LHDHNGKTITYLTNSVGDCLFRDDSNISWTDAAWEIIEQLIDKAYDELNRDMSDDVALTFGK